MSAHTRWLLSALLLLATAMGAGCSDEPKQDWGVATYKEHADTIKAIDTMLLKELKTFAPAPTANLPKEDAARKKAQADLKARKAAFIKNVSTSLSKNPNVLGWEITYSFPKDEKPPFEYGGEGLSDQAPLLKGKTLRAARRKHRPDKKSDHRISWGLYDQREFGVPFEKQEMKKEQGVEAIYKLSQESGPHTIQLSISIFLRKKSQK